MNNTRIRTTRSFLAMLMLLAMLLSMPALAYAEEAPVADGSSTAESAVITINNVYANESFRGWRIVDISYDSTTNTQTYTFNTLFAPYFEGKGVKIEDFMDQTKYKDDSTALNTLLSGLPAYIKANLSEQTAQAITKTVAADGNSLSFDGVQAGSYFVEVLESARIYQPLLLSITPKVENGKFVYKDLTVSAKSTQVGVTKKVSNLGSDYADSTTAQSANLDSETNAAVYTVTYKLTMDVPHYVSPTNVATLKLEDVLPDGITYISDTVEVYGLTNASDESDKTLLTAHTTAENKDTAGYDLTAAATGITIDFAEHYAAISSYACIEVFYDAKVDTGVAVKTASTTPNTNTVTYSYSKYPYVTESTDSVVGTGTASASVWTYGLTVLKVNKDQNARKPLADAEFSLYRTPIASDEQSVRVKLKDTDGNKTIDAVLVETGITTGADGKASVVGLSNMVYYLVETKAPSGYTLDDTAVKCDLSKGLANSEDGYLKITVQNAETNLQLPQTGATGLVVFSILGAVVMAGAVVYLVLVLRKKSV